MGTLVESVIAAFDSNTELSWTTQGLAVVLATFRHNDLLVTITFAQTEQAVWQAGFTVAPETQSATFVAQASLRIFSGVFQAVREFLEVRQPEKLVFASKNEALGDLYEAYLEREDTAVHAMGYRVVQTRIEPFTEFALVKTSPSAWRG